MKKLLLASLSLLLSPALFAQTAVETLSLEKAVRLAIENSVATLQAKNNYELTGAQLLQAYG
ncbi:MAG: hypothetical protein NZ844_06925, partial [Chloroherpetonaceae bacterium]|nr:hypothetical protein [Chloroherpetonaceae bacterium]